MRVNDTFERISLLPALSADTRTHATRSADLHARGRGERAFSDGGDGGAGTLIHTGDVARRSTRYARRRE